MTSQTADVLLIGAGITGLITALHLKEMGVSNVVILERHHAGAGQSGRAAGIVRALVNNTAVSSCLMQSLRFFEAFNERYEQAVPRHQPGYLLVDHAKNAAVMNSVIQNAVAAGCNARRISAAEAAELQPGLRNDGDDIYAYEPGGIHVDPMLTTQAMAAIVKRMGVRIEYGCEVESLYIEDSKVRGVYCAHGTFSAPKVVIATSVLGAAQLQRVGIDVPVSPHRAEMAFFAVFPQSPYRLRRIISDARTSLYLRSEGADQMFVGWRESDRISQPSDLAAVDPENYRQTSNYVSLKDMHDRLSSTLPFMADGFVHRTYACVYDYTPDGMPILDEAEHIPGLYFALGFSGGGFSLSPWVGSVMASLVATGSKPPEMSRFDLKRFKEKRLLSWTNTASGD